MKRTGAILFLAALVGAGGGWWWWQQQNAGVLEYSVVSGDTLFLIAKAHDVTVDELRTWNGIDGDLIEVGQILRIHRAPVAVDAAPVPPRKQASRGRRRAAAPSGPEERVWPPLVLPRAKRCLAGPELSGDGDDPEFAASAGLSRDQVRTAMHGYLPQALRCVPESGLVAGTIETSITVGCNGRVERVQVLSTSYSADMTSCVRDVVGYTPFPAHDMEGGMTFEFPIQLSP